MAVINDWAQDPSVQFMRRVFRHMEAAQKEILKSLSISPFDARLRLWRETARKAFEQSWAHAVKLDIDLEDEKAAAIYVHCLAQAISLGGIKVPVEILPKDEKIEMLIKETLQ